MSAATHYSPHFTRREMRASETAARLHIDNTPPPDAEANLVRLCGDFLEPIRAHFGAIRVTSGYRCVDLNSTIGGSLTSAHIDGRAADFEPLSGATLKSVMEWLVRSSLPFDQAIYEFGGWIHLGIAKAGKKPRRQALMIFRSNKYEPFNAADPRVTA